MIGSPPKVSNFNRLFLKLKLKLNPSDSKSNRLHVEDIFQFCFIHLRYILP